MAGLKRCLSTLAFLYWVTGPEHVAAEQPLAVVLASTAPGYAMGQVLAATEVAVPDGASTIFLLPSGQLITIKGPYSGLLTSQQPAAPAAGAGAASSAGAGPKRVRGYALDRAGFVLGHA